ncbi:MAG: HAMP domain-containing sensor histidine kinase [Planctomycetota bacterium]|nr:HAMP domain-containing sensor histidine kinase [Planctomycetota bacterium]
MTRPGGGLLESLARTQAWRGLGGDWVEGPATPWELEGFLEEVRRELGARRVEWLAPGAPRGGARNPRAIDWALAARVAPAEVHLIGAEDRRRYPRLAAGDGRELYVRPGPGVEPQGLLRVVSDRALPLGRAAFVALAELVAGVVRTVEHREERATARRERELGRQAAALTHDLRNQLTLALMQLDRVRAEEQLSALGGLEEVLATARELCASSLSDAPSSFGAKRLVLRSILLAQARAANSVSRWGRQVAVKVRCPLDLHVRAELGTLERLVHNMVVNAVEASSDGDEVRVEGKRLDDGRVAVTIEDQGRGMSRERLERLLSPERVSGDGTGYGGTSLRACLGRLEAECVVETAPGRGTRCEVRLDGADADGTEPVLVVDPDPSRRRRRISTLRSLGRAAVGAASPDEALGVLRRCPVSGLVLARGTAGAGLQALAERADRSGVPVERLVAGL